MSDTGNGNGNNTTPALISSCCGKTFNGPSSEILDCVFVDDNYVKREAVSWIQKNLSEYKFVGKEAKNLKKKLQDTSKSNIYSDEVDKILSEFFAMFANNPYCAENGICILEDSFIVGKKLECYFVLYKKDIIIPFGCLELFVHDQIKTVQRNYLEAAKRFALKATYQTTICFEEMKTNLAKTNRVRMASLPRAIFGFITFILSLIYVISCLASVEWSNLEYYMTYATDFFQAMRFAVEKGFNITHNSNLGLVLLALGVFWLLHLLIRNIKFVKEFKNQKNVNKLKSTRKSFNLVNDNLETIDSNVKQADEFANGNLESFSKIFLKPNFPEKKFGPKIVSLGENRDLKFNDTMKPVLPKTLSLIISLCLIVSTLFFAGNCKNDEAFNAHMSNVFRVKTRSRSSSELHVVNNYITNSATDVLTKSVPNSLVIYHLEEGVNCTVIDDESSEEYAEVSFTSDDGVLSGWVAKTDLTVYHPKMDKTLYKKSPLCAYASSSIGYDPNNDVDYVPENTIDGELGTVWQEGAEGDGSGEWIRYDFDGESTQISSIGIYNGDSRSETLYYKNPRVIEIAIKFYQDSESFSDTVYYTFEDGVFGMQYINLSKPVEATSVEIGLISVSEDYYYPDACISEVEFYCVNPDVQ